MKEANTDPYGFYQLWLKSLKDGQDSVLQASNQGIHGSREAWKQWLDATMATWQKTAEMGADPLGLTSQWLKMMDTVQEKMLVGGTIPSDPFTFFKDWYDAISESWSRVVEHTIASEQFLEFNKQFLESYTSFTRAFRHANEEYLRILQLPSRSDVSHVSELVVALEEKVDRLDDRFEDVDSALSQTPKREAISGLESRLTAFESRLNQSIIGIEAHLESVESQLIQSIASVESQFAQSNAGVEGHLTSIERQLAQSVADVNSRVERVESQFAKSVAGVEAHFKGAETHLESVERRFAQSVTDVEGHVKGVEQRLVRSIADVEKHVSGVERQIGTVAENLDIAQHNTGVIVSDITGQLHGIENALGSMTGSVEGRLDTIQHKLNAPSQLESRLEAVESKLDVLHGQLEQFRTVQEFAQRLEQVESKLDAILAGLSKIEAYEANGYDESKTSASHKSHKKKSAHTEDDEQTSSTDS